MNYRTLFVVAALAMLATPAYKQWLAEAAAEPMALAHYDAI